MDEARMRTFQWGATPVVRRYSSLQVPYFFHTLLALPYRQVEAAGPSVVWEKRQVAAPGAVDRWVVAQHFREDCLAVREPRENVLIPYLPREEATYGQVDGVLAHFRKLECGVTLLLEEPFPIEVPESVAVMVSGVPLVMDSGPFDLCGMPRVPAVVYPVFPGFSDGLADWERHFARLREQGVETVVPFVPLFDAVTIKGFMETAARRGRDLARLQEIFFHRSRKEYVAHIWQRILPALHAAGLRALPKLPPQAGGLYQNRCLALRCFFLWHWLALCGREIEAWRFHRVGFLLWRAAWDVRQIQREGNLGLFDLDFLDDTLRGRQPFLYPDEKLWL
jgi:hypothetical protein